MSRVIESPSRLDLKKEEIKRRDKSKESFDQKMEELNLVKNKTPQNKKKPILIAFYAEKGGVGKTTLCITIAHMFARSKRVLIYDVDPQRSATTWLFGNELYIQHIRNDQDDYLNQLIEQKIASSCQNPDNYHKTLYDQVHDANHNLIKPAFAHRIRKNLYLVPGNRKTHLLDGEITKNECFASMDPNIQNTKTGKPFNSIMRTAKEFNIDYVFIDLNPNLGILNQRVIMTSHFLIMPTNPDYFSAEMMRSLNLNEWQNDLNRVRETANASNYPLPNHTVKFLGYILNRYIPVGRFHGLPLENGLTRDRLRRTQNTWADRINEYARNIINEFGNQNPRLAIHPRTYTRLNISFLIGKVREYRHIGDFADLFAVPVPFLTEDHLYQLEIDNDGNEFYHRLEPGDRAEELEKIREWFQIFAAIENNILRIMKNKEIINC